MKVGTDGVLLGAWAGPGRPGEISGGSPQTVLDIGTGSGLVALMLAQRYPEEAQGRSHLPPGILPRYRCHSCRPPLRPDSLQPAVLRHHPHQPGPAPDCRPPYRRSHPRRTTAALRRPPLRHGGLQSDRSLRLREIHPAAGGQKQAPSAPAHPRLFQTVLPAQAYPGHLRQNKRRACNRRDRLPH